MNADTFAIGGIVRFDPEDPIYTEHFPGNPVVPGSVIIDAFFHALEKAGAAGREMRIERFRFLRFVSPGEYAYRIEVRPEYLVCELLHGGRIVAKGRLKR